MKDQMEKREFNPKDKLVLSQYFDREGIKHLAESIYIDMSRQTARHAENGKLTKTDRMFVKVADEYGPSFGITQRAADKIKARLERMIQDDPSLMERPKESLRQYSYDPKVGVLRKAGWSIRMIAEILGTTKNQVERSLEEYEAREAAAKAAEEAKQTKFGFLGEIPPTLPAEHD